MKTLLLALISPGKNKGTREGAIRGLVGVGKEAVRKGLVEGGGARVVGSECAAGEGGEVVNAVMVSITPDLLSQWKDVPIVQSVYTGRFTSPATSLRYGGFLGQRERGRRSGFCAAQRAFGRLLRGEGCWGRCVG